MELAKIEKEYVKKYNSLAPNGYNLDEGGKGVASVSSIEKPFWKRKSLKSYRNLSKIYQLAVTNCPRYNGWSIIISVLKTTDRGRK